jgi:hypothetical protein
MITMTSTAAIITLLQPVIAQLTSVGILNTTIEPANQDKPDLSMVTNIFVGYAGISSINSNQAKEHDLYNRTGQDLSQDFDIQIVCLETNLPIIWSYIYNALIGQHPIPQYAEYSGLTYVQGGPMGLSNENLWWVDRWSIGFPLI